jgi:2-oxoglutarate dehydrogenase E1 component
MRRQVAWEFRKPCIVFSPKSLLRHPLVASPMKDFTKGSFQEVIDDANVNAKDVRKVVLCTGKVYYDLLEGSTKTQNQRCSYCKIEQLHPFPEKQLNALLKKYKGAETGLGSGRTIKHGLLVVHVTIHDWKIWR